MFIDYINETQNILSHLRASRRDVVIFGAGVAGEALFHVCNDAGVVPSCFYDNNSNKAGHLLCGIPVFHISEVKNKVIKPIFLISAADIGDVVEQLEGLGFTDWFDSSQLLAGFDVSRNLLSVPPDFADYVISTCCVCHQAFRNPDALFLRSIDIVITERCSLRCLDCANLMQYYKKPKNYSLEGILDSIDSLSRVVDRVNEVRVIGGEPLMSPFFPQVIKHLVNEPKLREVIIYTNGTISLSEKCIKELQHPKVIFYITDYGDLSKNLKQLTDQLAKHSIRHFVQIAKGWAKCGSIKLHQRKHCEKNTVFKDCCAKHLVTLMDGILYRCPFAANATNLHAIPYNFEDSVRLVADSCQQLDSNNIKRDILRLLSRREPLNACDYCEGRPYGAPEIQPAIQVSLPLEYQEYTWNNLVNK